MTCQLFVDNVFLITSSNQQLLTTPEGFDAESEAMGMRANDFPI